MTELKRSVMRGRVPLVLLSGIFIALSSLTQVAKAETKYTITATTGKTGTNADIIVKLHGTEGSFSTWSRPLDTPADDFEPNQTNVFVIPDQRDIGVVTDIEIKGFGRGLHTDPWEMKSITVSSNGKKSNKIETKFSYSKGLINQWDIDREFPEHKSLLLRANNLTDPKFEYDERTVIVGEVWKAYGGLSDLGTERTIVYTRNDVESSEQMERDMTKVENTSELEVKQTFPLVGTEARALYRLHIAKEHEKLRKQTRSSSRGKSETIKISVPPKQMLFQKVTYSERRKFVNFKSLIETNSRYVVLEEEISTEGVVFKYADEVVYGYSFKDLYKKVYPNRKLPDGPLMPKGVKEPAAPVPTTVTKTTTTTPLNRSGTTPVTSTGNLEQDCFNAIQGKVAYNRAGATSWSASHVKNLCLRTKNPQNTINCFKAEIVSHNQWQKAIENCKTKSSTSTPPVTAKPVNGLSVKQVMFNGGAFVHKGQKNWVETGSNNQAKFNFTEVARDEWSVYLKDGSRNISIVLNLWTKKIMYGVGNAPKTMLYKIDNAL